MQVFSGGQRDGDEFLHLKIADYMTRLMRLLWNVARTSPGRCCEGNPLGEVRAVRSSVLCECGYVIGGHTTGISTSQPNSAPQVGAPAGIETLDGRVNIRTMSAMDEPQAAPQSLIEDASSVHSASSWWTARFDGSTPREESFVESIAVDREPSEQRVKSTDRFVWGAAQAGPRESDAGMDQVSVQVATHRQ
jgi:hypothetical protein